MPNYALQCQRHHKFERTCFYRDKFAPCPTCGAPVENDWMAPSRQSHPFASYFDWGLGVEVTSLGQRHQLMRENALDYRDKLKPGDISARNDRINERKKEEGRR